MTYEQIEPPRRQARQEELEQVEAPLHHVQQGVVAEKLRASSALPFLSCLSWRLGG
jgi:hypothetical protein